MSQTAASQQQQQQSYLALLELLRRSGMDIDALLRSAAEVGGRLGDGNRTEEKEEARSGGRGSGKEREREDAHSEEMKRTGGTAGVALAVAGLLLVLGRGFVGGGAESLRAPNKLVSLLGQASPDSLLSLLRFSLAEMESVLCSGEGRGGDAAAVSVRAGENQITAVADGGGAGFLPASPPVYLSSRTPSPSANPIQYGVLLSASLSSLCSTGLDHFTPAQLASLAELLPLSGPQRALVPRKFWGIFLEEVGRRWKAGEIVAGGGGDAAAVSAVSKGEGPEDIGRAIEAVTLLHTLSRLPHQISDPTLHPPTFPQQQQHDHHNNKDSPASVARGIFLELVSHPPSVKALSLAASQNPLILDRLAYSAGVLFKRGLQSPNNTQTPGLGSSPPGDVPLEILQAMAISVIAAPPENLPTETLWEVLLFLDRCGCGGGGEVGESKSSASSVRGGPCIAGAWEALLKTLLARSTREYHAMGLAGLLRLFSHLATSSGPRSTTTIHAATTSNISSTDTSNPSSRANERRRGGGVWDRISDSHAREIARAVLVRLRYGEAHLDRAALTAFLAASSSLFRNGVLLGGVTEECVTLSSTLLVAASASSYSSSSSSSKNKISSNGKFGGGGSGTSPLATAHSLYSLLEIWSMLQGCPSLLSGEEGESTTAGVASARQAQGRILPLLSQLLLPSEGGVGAASLPLSHLTSSQLISLWEHSQQFLREGLVGALAAQSPPLRRDGSGAGVVVSAPAPAPTVSPSPTTLAVLAAATTGGAGLIRAELGLLGERVAAELEKRVEWDGGLGSAQEGTRILGVLGKQERTSCMIDSSSTRTSSKV